MPSVYISPSTQEANIGVGQYGTEEKRMNEIADILVPLLKANGLTVYRNRPEMTLQQVVKDSNAKNVDAHVAIHSNAGGGEGTEIWVYKLGYNAERLAKCIYDELAPLSPGKDRGVKENPDFYETRKTKAPAVIVEVGFHDNPADATWIASNQKAIARAIAKGICKYFGREYKEPSEPALKPGSGAGNASAPQNAGGGQAKTLPLSSFPEAQKWVKEKGISDGSNPTAPATREQVWEMLYRLIVKRGDRMRNYCPLRASQDDDTCRGGECEWWITEWHGCAVWVLATLLALEKGGR